MTNALELVNQPALALDRSGFVLDMNAAAERILDDEVRVRNRRLCVRDRQANAALDALIDRLRTTPDTAALPGAPIVVQRSKKRPLVVRGIPFLGARVLLVLSDLDGKPLPDAALIARLFGLSPAETRLASLIVAGLSLVQAAEELGVVHETVRTHLKAMFDKTGTRRQSELVAMLARVSRFSPSRG
jgi:DNA-binding CsgD family transcriptional regulator